MLNKYAVSAAILVVSVSAHAWDKLKGVGHAEVKGVARIEAEWVKDKNDKYDVSMKMTNETDGTILFFAGDMKCSRGGDGSGNIDVHDARRTIDLRKNESRTVLMTCRLDKTDKGDFKITLKAFSNPSGDSNTPGKVLIDKMVWKQGQNEGAKW